METIWHSLTDGKFSAAMQNSITYILRFLKAELEKEGLPETESLWWMAQSSAHRKVVFFHFFFYKFPFLISYCSWQRKFISSKFPYSNTKKNFRNFFLIIVMFITWKKTAFCQFRHLLRHPAVTSFLWLKWQRIRRYISVQATWIKINNYRVINSKKRGQAEYKKKLGVFP